MSIVDALISTRVCLPLPSHSTFRRRSVTQKRRSNLAFRREIGIRTPLVIRRPLLMQPAASSAFGNGAAESEEDFVTRVLRETPSQIEPRFLIGGKFYTLNEKEELRKPEGKGLFEVLKKRLLVSKNGAKKREDEGDESGKQQHVYLKDILRKYKGKLYVPEQVFEAAALSEEEEEFDKKVDELPRMCLEDFKKHMIADKVKLLTSKEPSSRSKYRNFIVDLKDIPGLRHLHRTQWTMRLDEFDTRALLEEYTGPQYGIETRQNTSVIGQPAEYPHPVASSISSGVMMSLGTVTAMLVAPAAFVGVFIASIIYAAASVVYRGVLFVVLPISKPLFKLFCNLASTIAETFMDYLTDFFSEGGGFSKLAKIYTFGGISSSLQLLAKILLLVLPMALVLRFTLSTRSKKFRQWDLWQFIEFSRSKAEARVDGSTGVKFADVAGIDEAVDELQELVRYLKNPELFDKMGIKPPHGVLLEGPPGCGKTLVAKAIAGEAGVPFYQMAGSEFVEVLAGVGAARIRDLFKRAKVNKPSVIFIDEIDALAIRRQGIFSGSTNQLHNIFIQERETTLNQLLVELDGFDTGKGVIFLGATNRRDLLDPALLRPGRFDCKIKILPPNAKGRTQILKIHAGKVRMSNTVDLSSYAQNLPGWTGAKLAQLIQEAALVAIRKKHKEILQSDMDDAVDRLTVGPKRVGVDLGHQGQCRRATTEVGVALTSHLLRRHEDAKLESCERISIEPRGQTLSQLVFHRLDEESYMFERKPQLLHRLQVFLGGRAAEEVIYGRDTSKASVNYLADASWLARKIITIWNLENPMVIHGEPPPWRKKVRFEGPRLDFEGSLYDDYGLIELPINFNLDDDQVAKRTEELLRQMYDKTVTLLCNHHAALLKTIKVLVDNKEISGAEIDYILDNYPPQMPINRRKSWKHSFHQTSSLPESSSADSLIFSLTSRF
ncbi:unnamed protein product [Rhodiola kirilowii]